MSDWEEYKAKMMKRNPELVIAVDKLAKDLKWIRESNLIEDIDDVNRDYDGLDAWDSLLYYYPKLTLEAILETHKMLLQYIDPEIAGKLRSCNVTVGGRLCPGWFQVPLLMKQWLENGYGAASTEEQIKKAHVEFEKIHPFQDGNGRTGRMIMNYQRVKAGLEPLCILAAERSKYYEWFNENN